MSFSDCISTASIAVQVSRRKCSNDIYLVKQQYDKDILISRVFLVKGYPKYLPSVPLDLVILQAASRETA